MIDAPLLTVQDVRVELGGTPILRGVSAGVARRRITALIGLNGSGKTTLLKAILKEVPYSGQIAGDCAARTEREGRLTSRGNRMEGDGGRANKKAQGGVIGGTHLAWA